MSDHLVCPQPRLNINQNRPFQGSGLSCLKRLYVICLLELQCRPTASWRNCHFRLAAVVDALNRSLAASGLTTDDLTAIVGRGGLLRGIPGGTYQVNQGDAG